MDILPFIYWAALGNSSWCPNSSDIVQYLAGREAIHDLMFNAATATQRRTVSVPNSSGAMVELPYIVHTTDDYPNPHLWNNSLFPQPGHAIGVRTVDRSFYVANPPDYSLNFYGGGKLGMYTYWLPCSTYPNTSAEQQFEFYDYYTNNYGENGNSAFDSGNWNATAGAYLNAYNNIMAGELYNIYPLFQPGYNTAFNACMVYLNSITDGPNPSSCTSLPPWPPMNIVAP